MTITAPIPIAHHTSRVSATLPLPFNFDASEPAGFGFLVAAMTKR
jgi:hypothetical protein